jgi:hypothetical protein
LWLCVISYVVTSVSEELDASIFRVEAEAKKSEDNEGRMEQYVPPKRRQPTTRMHDVTIHKMEVLSYYF